MPERSEHPVTRPTSPPATAVAAIDVGGTTLKGAVFTDEGRVVVRLVRPTFGVDSDALATLRSLVRELVEAAAAAGLRCRAVGVASPGLVDTDTGRIRYAANLGWTDLPLRDLLEADVQLPVRVDHDARTAASAERAAHAAEAAEFRDFLFVPIGTGVAVAVVTAGILVRGATGGAGEFGHVPVVPRGELCGCGQHGCLEAYASATSILDRYRRRGGRRARSTPEIVATLMTDPDARAVWTEAVDALATGIAGVSAVLDPSRVVIGGGLSRAGEALLRPLRLAVDAKLGWRSTPSILRSVLGSDAGLIGAAVLVGEETATADFTSTAVLSLSEGALPVPLAPVPLDSSPRR